jgi:hypothetical protein
VLDAGAGGTSVIPGPNKSFVITLVNIDLHENLNFMAHEMGHNLGLHHSLDLSNAPGNPEGEYMDAWDVMGGTGLNRNNQLQGGIFAFNGTTFKQIGPGLSAPQINRKGWFGNGSGVTKLQVFDIPLGRNNFTHNDTRTIVLLSLSGRKSKSDNGVYAIRISYINKATNEPMAYWIEMRSKENWDRGIPENVVLIRRETPKGITLLVPDADQPTQAWKVNQTFIDESLNVSIRIAQIGPKEAAIYIKEFASSLKSVPQIQRAATIAISGAGIALASISSAHQSDIVVSIIENRTAGTGTQTNETERNKIVYRIGYNVDSKGDVTVIPNSPFLSGWSAVKEGPSIGHWENQGADIAIGDINKSGRPDFLFAYIDRTGSINQIYYTIGWDVNTAGDVSRWSNQLSVPLFSESGQKIGTSFQNGGCGVALADISGNGKLDLIVLYIEDQQQINKAYYLIGWDIDNTGNPALWSERRQIPNFGNWETQGCGVAVQDINSNGKLDLVFGFIDDSEGKNKFQYIIGKELNKDGFPTSWSNRIELPLSLGNTHAGGGLSIGKIANATSPSMFALMVEKTETNSLISYSYLNSIEARNDIS